MTMRSHIHALSRFTSEGKSAVPIAYVSDGEQNSSSLRVVDGARDMLQAGLSPN
jgi:hypothetical protein